MKSQFVSNLGHCHGVWKVLLVCQYQERSIMQLFLLRKKRGETLTYSCSVVLSCLASVLLQTILISCYHYRYRVKKGGTGLDWPHLGYDGVPSLPQGFCPSHGCPPQRPGLDCSACNVSIMVWSVCLLFIHKTIINLAFPSIIVCLSVKHVVGWLFS